MSADRAIAIAAIGRPGDRDRDRDQRVLAATDVVIAPTVARAVEP